MEHSHTTLNEFAIQFPIFFMIPQGYLPCAKLYLLTGLFFKSFILRFVSFTVDSRFHHTLRSFLFQLPEYKVLSTGIASSCHK